jgi:hypothetical protein
MENWTDILRVGLFGQVAEQKLYKAGYVRELLATNPDVDESLGSLLRQCREMAVRLGQTENASIRSLQQDRLLAEPVEYVAMRCVRQTPRNAHHCRSNATNLCRPR